MLNTIILYQNVSCVSGNDYLACMRKKSEIIEDYLVILSYTTVIVLFNVIQLHSELVKNIMLLEETSSTRHIGTRILWRLSLQNKKNCREISFFGTIQKAY